jgi:hypothetical protein
MREPSSSHLGVLWSRVLGHVLAPVHQEQDRYRAKGSLRLRIHLCNVCDPWGVEALRLNVVSATARKMNGARPTFSHGSLVMIKWTMCCYRETVCLLETQYETDTVSLGNKRGG